MTDAPPIIQLDHVSRIYGGVRAVDGVSLSVAHGTFLAIIGPSGCGKSTTIRLINRLIEHAELHQHVGMQATDVKVARHLCQQFSRFHQRARVRAALQQQIRQVAPRNDVDR